MQLNAPIVFAQLAGNWQLWLFSEHSSTEDKKRKKKQIRMDVFRHCHPEISKQLPDCVKPKLLKGFERQTLFKSTVISVGILSHTSRAVNLSQKSGIWK